ncbi:MAG: hypothetical protein PHV77_02310 [Candidatus Omnitrophica bacterium]|nr:hypothetical protein [Candidatus Omnitrophota bacterium]
MAHNNIPAALLAAALSFTFIAPAKAGSLGDTQVSFSTGKRSQTDGTDERDLSGDYSFYQYALTAKATPSDDISYKISFKDYRKEFDQSDDSLDNRTLQYNARFAMPLHKKEDLSLKFAIDYNLRLKRYKNNPNQEYDNNTISAALGIKTFKHYSLGISAGINDYDYAKKSSQDQRKAFFKVSPSAKFFDERLALSGYYRRNEVCNSGKRDDYSEDIMSLKSSMKLNLPFLYKIGGSFSYGRNDTRDDEEDREDDLRFEYKKWDISTYHRLSNRIDSRLTYGRQDRRYLTSSDSYDNWLIKNRTRFGLVKKGLFHTDMILGYEHRETSFLSNNSLSYNKNGYNAGLAFSQMGQWSVKPAVTFTDYKYRPLSPRNEKQYKAEISCSKYIGSTDNTLELDYWYKWKNYEYKPNIEQWAVNISYSARF